MAQGFVFGTPAGKSNLSSAAVRINLNAIGSLNAGPVAPTSPTLGMPWLDTSDEPAVFRLNIFNGGAFVVVLTFPSLAGIANKVLFAISPATTTWTLTHTLGAVTVSVDLYDINSKKIEALVVDVTNPNQVVVTHAYAIEGFAIVIG